MLLSVVSAGYPNGRGMRTVQAAFRPCRRGLPRQQAQTRWGDGRDTRSPKPRRRAR